MPGFGVTAKVGGRVVSVGADRFMTQLGLDVVSFKSAAQRLGEQGKSPLYAAIDGRLAAVIAVADPIKETTPEAIKALHALGLKVAMITGDNAATAAAIAKQLGIDEVAAEVLPDGKVAALKSSGSTGREWPLWGRYQRRPGVSGSGRWAGYRHRYRCGYRGGRRGADVWRPARGAERYRTQPGDDPQYQTEPVLGLCLQRGADPVAAGALYPLNGTLLSPIFAAAAMALSSVFVLGNALRLKRFQAPMTVEASSGTAESGAEIIPVTASK